MIWLERFRANIAAGLFFTIVYHGWHQPERLGRIMLSALIFVVTVTTLDSLRDAINGRRQWPKWRKRSNGPV